MGRGGDEAPWREGGEYFGGKNNWLEGGRGGKPLHLAAPQQVSRTRHPTVLHPQRRETASPTVLDPRRREMAYPRLEGGVCIIATAAWGCRWVLWGCRWVLWVCFGYSV